MDLRKELQLILDQTNKNNPLSSELGFFSKPSRIKGSDGHEYILKFYRPIKNELTAQQLLSHHNNYVLTLASTGILIPPTKIDLIKEKGKYKPVIIQPAFEEKELVRGIMETCDEKQFLFLLGKLLDDTFQFWLNKASLDPSLDLGFHPTLRNYAWKDEKLHYFDTFPPMLVSQKELNKLIINMAPAKFNLRFLVPNKVVNRVSNEYYQKDKMLIGIVGSSCRLRPELSQSILFFCRHYMSHSPGLKEEEKVHLMEQLNTPPQLSGIWVTFRKLFGKTGKPNIK